MAWTLPKMTPQMAAFVRAYLAADGNVTRACAALGIPKPHGFRYKRDERVQAAIALGHVPEDAVDENGARVIAVPKAKGERTGKDVRRAGKARKQRTVAARVEVAESYAEPLPAQPETPVTYDRARVLNRLALVAEANILGLFKPERRSGKTKMVPRALDEIPAELAYAIDRVEVTASGTFKFHLLSKMDALMALGRAVNAFSQGGAGGGADAPESPRPDGAVVRQGMSLEERMKRYGENVREFPGKPAG